MRGKKLVLILSILYLFCSSLPLWAKKTKIYLNFDQVELKSLVQFISKELKKNIIYDESLRGKVTIISNKPVDEKTLWQMLSEAVSLAGGVIYQEDGYIKIVSQRKLRDTTPPSGKRPEKFFGEPYILIYSLSKLNPSKLVRILRPLLSPKGFVSYISGTPILVIKDYASNLTKIKKFIESLEKEKLLPQVKIFKLKDASANEVYRNLSPIIQTLVSEKGLIFKMVKDERTNSLIIYGNEEVFKDVEKILREIDVPVKDVERRFYVLPIKYSSAEDLAKVLKSLNLKRIPIDTRHKGRTFLTQGLQLTADKNSNSLVIYATKKEFEKIKELVEKLDVQRKQVLLATTVVEVSLSKLRDFGVHWQAFGNYGGISFGGLSQTDVYNAIHQGKLVIGTLSQSGETFSLGGVNLFFPDLLFLFSLLEESSSFHILSNPKILTLDNQKAEIKVGESVPYTTGITYQTNTLPTVSFEYRDVGLDLKITPHISGNTVRLEINQNIQEVTQVYRAMQGTIDFVAPVTSKREITSEVIVENGQTVILGGLVSNKSKRNDSHIPGLSSIPLLGWFFKRSNIQDQKTTLFVFITPYIISTPEELKRITEEHRLLAEDLKLLMDFTKKKSSKGKK